MSSLPFGTVLGLRGQDALGRFIPTPAPEIIVMIVGGAEASDKIAVQTLQRSGAFTSMARWWPLDRPVPISIPDLNRWDVLDIPD